MNDSKRKAIRRKIQRKTLGITIILSISVILGMIEMPQNLETGIPGREPVTTEVDLTGGLDINPSLLDA